MTDHNNNQTGFAGLGISPGLLKRLAALGFTKPTPIQQKAIPVATGDEDVVGIAQTGSGKTLAFSIPMLMRISAKKRIGLVLLPTRELAVQVEEALKQLAGPAGLRVALIIGGVGDGPQIRKLRAKPHVIVATPGRLIDLVENRKVNLSIVGSLVLDEADRMLDMGFAPQLKRIISEIPEERQTMLFSATMPQEIAEMAKQYLRQPLRIEVAPQGTTAETVDQEVFIVPRPDKLELLQKILAEHRGKVLVFSRTKHGASKLARKIRQMGHKADEIHSNRSQNQRQLALKGFAGNKYRVLVATDIAARGIDVKDIELVLNYDLPEMAEDYVHRIGRTGRAGRAGKAISFAMPEQKKDLLAIERLISLTLPRKSKTGETLKPDQPVKTGRRINTSPFRDDRSRSRKNSRRGPRGRRPSPDAPSHKPGGRGQSSRPAKRSRRPGGNSRTGSR
jgi:ATP-dependent RNA helicase RhlE